MVTGPDPASRDIVSVYESRQRWKLTNTFTAAGVLHRRSAPLEERRAAARGRAGASHGRRSRGALTGHTSPSLPRTPKIGVALQADTKKFHHQNSSRGTS